MSDCGIRDLLRCKSLIFLGILGLRRIVFCVNFSNWWYEQIVDGQDPVLENTSGKRVVTFNCIVVSDLKKISSCYDSNFVY